MRTISHPTRTDQYGNVWQYHSRSDHHSKVACAVVLLDLIANCPLLADHIRSGKVGFGINHEMRDFRQDRKKNLDLVICRPAGGAAPDGRSILDFAKEWQISFTAKEEALLKRQPLVRRTAVGSVLIALEAKACMTEHQKALPRLFDELNSSQLTVHGSSETALAAGFVCINASDTYLSPDRNKRPLDASATVTYHNQPKAAAITIEKVRQLPRRVRESEAGYDALGVVVIKCRNDGSAVELVNEPPAPAQSDIYHYDRMIERLAASYTARFREI